MYICKNNLIPQSIMKRLIILFAITICLGSTNKLFSQVSDEIYTPIPGTDKVDTSLSTATKYRIPYKATLLSFAYPGVGQLYNGQANKGGAFITWKIASDVLIAISIYGISENFLSSNGRGEGYFYLFLGSLTSAVTSWAVSMIDANLSAKKINKFYGFTNPKDKKSKLSINPDIKIIPQPYIPTTQTYSPSFGLNLSLSF